MPLLGQASGGWTESSSALRPLHIGVRNAIGVLTADAFTQANPTAVATNVSDQVDTTLTGVLSGSVAFVRPDGGSNFIGGPGSNAVQVALAAANAQAIGFRALGVFINSANGNAFENTPGTASGKNTYVSSNGTHGNGLFETALIANSADAVNSPAGAAITYIAGMRLMSSRNGFLMPTEVIGTDGGRDNADVIAMSAESFVHNANASATLVGLLKMAPDATQNELVYDQRI